MNTSSIQRSLISAACVAGTIFAASTVPLAMFRSEVVAIELQNRPLFSAELRDLAGPYLGITGVLSASIGIGIMGFSGWRQAARKSSVAESQLSDLQRNLQTQQLALEELKFSEVKLRAQNLDAFLEPTLSDTQSVAPRAPLAPVASTQAATGAVMQPSQNVSFHKPQIVSISPSQPVSSVSYQVLADRQSISETAGSVKNKAVMALSAAQSYASYSRSNGVMGGNDSVSKNPAGTQLDQLLTQLRDITNQVEELRTGTSNGIAA
ncbi:MAG TPA: hypothetical protein V6D29_20900 [Leptolyngbyaceae cyanobacterium]